MLSKMVCWRKCHLLSTEHEGDFLLMWNCSGKVICPSSVERNDLGDGPIFYANYVEKLKNGNGGRPWVQDIKEDPPKQCFYREYHTGEIREPGWFNMLVDLETDRVYSISPGELLGRSEGKEGFFINSHGHDVLIYHVFTHDPIDKVGVLKKLHKTTKGKKHFKWHTMRP